MILFAGGMGSSRLAGWAVLIKGQTHKKLHLAGWAVMREKGISATKKKHVLFDRRKRSSKKRTKKGLIATKCFWEQVEKMSRDQTFFGSFLEAR